VEVHQGAAHHQGPPRDAFLAARPVFALGIPGRAAPVDAMSETFGRSLAVPRAAAPSDLSRPRTQLEPPLQDVAPQEQSAVQEHSGSRRESRGAMALRVSGQLPAVQRPPHQEQLQDAVAEQHSDEQHREQQPAALQKSQLQARRRVLERRPERRLP
jgi:hypothetical protein